MNNNYTGRHRAEQFLPDSTHDAVAEAFMLFFVSTVVMVAVIAFGTMAIKAIF